MTFSIFAINEMTFSIISFNIMTLGVMPINEMTFSLMTVSKAAIRKDCFQVKSNLLTVDNMVFHF